MMVNSDEGAGKSRITQWKATLGFIASNMVISLLLVHLKIHATVRQVCLLLPRIEQNSFWHEVQHPATLSIKYSIGIRSQCESNVYHSARLSYGSIVRGRLSIAWLFLAHKSLTMNSSTILRGNFRLLR